MVNKIDQKQNEMKKIEDKYNGDLINMKLYCKISSSF